MMKLKLLFVRSGPLLAAIVAGFIGGWCATITQSACAQTAKPPRVLSLHQLNLIDANGKIQGILSGGPYPSLDFFRTDGSAALSLRVADDSSAVFNLNKPNAKAGVAISVHPKGDSLVTLFGESGEGRLNLDLIENQPSVNMTNRSKKNVVFLSVAADESGEFLLSDAYGQPKR